MESFFLPDEQPAGRIQSEITPPLQLLLLGNHTNLFALSVMGYNAAMPGECVLVARQRNHKYRIDD